MLLRLHQLQLQLQESSSNTVPDSEAIKTKLVSRYLSGIKTRQVFHCSFWFLEWRAWEAQTRRSTIKSVGRRTKRVQTREWGAEKVCFGSARRGLRCSVGCEVSRQRTGRKASFLIKTFSTCFYWVLNDIMEFSMFWQDPTNSIVEPRHEGTGARQSVEPVGSRDSLASTQNCDSRLQRSRQSESAPAIPSTRCTLSCIIAFLSYFYHCLECALFFLQQNVKMRQGIGDVRRVTLHKKPNEGLGISVTVRLLK